MLSKGEDSRHQQEVTARAWAGAAAGRLLVLPVPRKDRWPSVCYALGNVACLAACVYAAVKTQMCAFPMPDRGDMVSHLSKRFDAWARGWIILALVATFIAFEELTLPILQSAPGGSIVSLDAQIFYRPEQAFSTIAAYGDSAQFWIRAYLTWDVANPILYTLVFGLLLSWLFQRGVSPASPLRRLNVLPVGAGCCDLLENACIVTLLAVYPAQPRLVAWLAAVCTLGKVSLLAVSTLLVAIGFVNAALNRFARKL